jgi:hypothetical protein
MSGCYTVTQIAAVAGLNRGTADTWLQRRYVADVPRIGGGRAGRRLTFHQAVILAALAELVRARIPVGAAAEFLAHEQIAESFPKVVAAGGADNVLTIGWKNDRPFIRMMLKETALQFMKHRPTALGDGVFLSVLYLDALIARVRSGLDSATSASSTTRGRSVGCQQP